MSFKDKKILVTGASGFIGSHLTDGLLEEGATVYGLDNLSGSTLDNLKIALKNPNFIFTKGDIRDTELLNSIMKETDMIFHLAAFISVKQSVLLPKECNDINVNGTLNLLEIARKFNVNQFIYSSSAAVYGDTEQLPITEIIPAKPVSPYGISKLTAEQYVLLYNKLYGMQTTALRYFNVYGSRQILSEYTGVIMIFLENLKKQKNFTIFGDGNHTRDFIHVSDVVAANLLAAINSVGGQLYNIATGMPTSIQTLAETMLKLVDNRQNSIIHANPVEGDIVHSYASIEKAKKDLKFQPKYTLKEGLREVIDWYLHAN